MREFTGERLNLDDDAGGKRGRDARPEVANLGQEAARGRIACATTDNLARRVQASSDDVVGEAFRRE